MTRDRHIGHIYRDAHLQGSTTLSNREAGRVISDLAGRSSTKMHNFGRAHGKGAPQATVTNKRLGLQIVCYGPSGWVALPL